MKTAIRTLITALVALAVVAPAAQADLWTPAQVTKAITVADAHWPASPCRGREAITWVKSVQSADFAGIAYPDQCATTIAWNQVAAQDPSPAFLCTVLEHEFGHLAGYEHSKDPDNVMFAILWKPSPDCAAALPGPAKLPRAGLPSTSKPRAKARSARRR
jgi:Matrixin